MGSSKQSNSEASLEAVRATAFDLALSASDPSGDQSELRAAMNAFRQASSQVDWEAYLDEIHVPRDAGEYADGLLRILNRIPKGYGRSVDCNKGWYPIITELDEKLSEINPGYVVEQVKEKYGTLRYFFTPDYPEHPVAPPSSGSSDAEYDKYSAACKAFDESPKGKDYKKLCHEIYQQMTDLVSGSEAAAVKTCENCGDPGEMRCTLGISAWYRTMCEDCAAEQGLVTMEDYKAWRKVAYPKYLAERNAEFLEDCAKKSIVVIGDDSIFLDEIKRDVINDEESVRALAREISYDDIWINDEKLGAEFRAELVAANQKVIEANAAEIARRDAKRGRSLPNQVGPNRPSGLSSRGIHHFIWSSGVEDFYSYRSLGMSVSMGDRRAKKPENYSGD